MPRISDAAISDKQNSSKVLEEAKLAASLRTIADAMDQMRIIKTLAAKNAASHFDETVSDRIQDYLRLRSRAKEILGVTLLFGPAWDILLSLYIDHSDGRQTDIGAVIAATGIPQATTTRWTRELVRQGLITRKVDTNDRRRAILKLTARAIEIIETVWQRRAGLPDLPLS